MKKIYIIISVLLICVLIIVGTYYLTKGSDQAAIEGDSITQNTNDTSEDADSYVGYILLNDAGLEPLELIVFSSDETPSGKLLIINETNSPASLRFGKRGSKDYQEVTVQPKSRATATLTEYTFYLLVNTKTSQGAVIELQRI